MRSDYCPIWGAPCQSCCETPCGTRKRLSRDEIDGIIADGGYRNAVGGIYAGDSVYRFANDIQDAMFRDPRENKANTNKEPT